MEGEGFGEGQRLLPLQSTVEGEPIFLNGYYNSLEIDVQPGLTKFILNGELDVQDAPSIAEFTKRFCAFATAGDTLALELSRVDFIDSTGLRIILEANQQCEEKRSKLVLLSPSDPVKHIFELSGITSIVVIEESEEP